MYLSLICVWVYMLTMFLNKLRYYYRNINKYIRIHINTCLERKFKKLDGEPTY